MARQILATGLDYSDGPLTTATARAARVPARTKGDPPTPVGFAVRYIDHPDRLGRKHTSKAEYAALRAAGWRVYLVAEHTAQDAEAGRAAGRALAKAARAGADSIGYPAGWPIFLTADEHLSAAQLPTALEFFRGAEDELGREATGGYGFSELIDALAEEGVCRWYWQTGSRSALRSVAHIYQCNDRANVTVNGVACDINEQYLPLPDLEDDVTPQDKTDIINGVATKVSHQLGLDQLPDGQQTLPAALDRFADSLATGAGNRYDTNGNPVPLATAAEVAALSTKLDTVVSAGVGPVDLDALADKLADRLAARLAN